MLIGPYFPKETLSVAELLRFKVPSLQTNLHSCACLSYHPPSIRDIIESDLRNTHWPSYPAINNLISEYESNFDNPPCSVKFGTCYIPIKILQIWETLFRVQNLQKVWKESEVQVRKLANRYPAQRVAILAAQKQLLSSKWNTKILGFSKSTSGCIGGLTRYLSFSCLVTTDISYHIELLKHALEVADISARLLSPLDIQYLTGCAMQSDGNGPERYRQSLTCKMLHQFGAELASGSVHQFGGIIHVNNHWIAFSISPLESTIYLGDSFHKPMGDDGQSVAVKEVIRVLRWWLDISSPEPSQSASLFQIRWLPIAYQNDFVSCGFFALDALMHHLIPNKYPLHTGEDAAILRVKFLTSILDRHSAQAAPTQTATMAATLVATPVTASVQVAMMPESPVLPAILMTTPATVDNLVGSNTRELEGRKSKVDLTIQEGNDKHGLLQFFSHVSHEEFEQQTMIEFERLAERRKGVQMAADLAARRKVERSRALARERQQRR
ncbi:uncharacterized protein EI90DRAFT_3024756 [Cantharellus anzutake]|uniref:uncharacterized protein n=1 Tax=Cantharellus anzutake TaxID=1750568 RepID=UPI001908F3A4|nr:uncharacterized protein EI90DRAFT_3024756 [Cantharellus anzutake]KAF8309944.1 hypothetical protein EI90DRAFT_3024756 [Cantharellus anzutake]